MKCSRCGFESNGYALISNCSVCGFSGSTGRSSVSNINDIVPWETESADKSPLRALAVTFQNSFFSSKRFFSTIAGNPAVIPALVYGMVFGSIGMCADAFWKSFPSLSLDLFFPDSGIIGGSSEVVSPAKLIAAPIILFASIFISTLYVHSLLFITRSLKKPFLFTFKTMCYAGSAMVFELFPVIGPLLTFIAMTYLTVTGIHSVQEISIRRTVLVLLMPILLLTIAVAIIGSIVVLVSGFISGAQIDPFSLFK